MDKYAFGIIDREGPKHNRKIVDGLATEEFKQIESYIDRIWRTATAELSPEITYHGLRAVNHREEYQELTRRTGGRNTIELARSNARMIEIDLRHNGEPLPKRYMYIPFVRRGGLITLRGSDFAISPVMADKAISVGPNLIFIPMAWDRINFLRTTHYFYANEVQESVPVVWSKIHHYVLKQRRTNSKMDVRANTTLPHYLFAKYGVTRTFAEMLNTHVVVGPSSEVNKETYPPDKWVVCKSNREKPRSVRDKAYMAPDVCIAVPLEKWGPAVAHLVAGFYYVADHFPDRVVADEVDEPRLWRVLLGYMIFGPGQSEGKLYDNISEHFGSLDNYIEVQTRQRLESVGVYVEDIYQLFMHLIENFDYYLAQSTSNLSSTYGKRLMAMSYATSDITWAIHRFMFMVQTQRKRKTLTKDDVLKIMNKTLKAPTMFRMNKNHGEVNPVSVSGDNIFFKITSHVVPQESSSGTRTKQRSTADDPSKILHISLAENGSYSTMKKAEPTGNGALNPMAILSPHDNELLRNPKLLDITEKTQAMIQRTA